MSRTAFQAFGSASPFQSKSASARSTPFRAEPQRERRDSDENQVVPFYLDDGADDNEEIRRRRYSSSYSSCQEEDDRSGRRRGPYKQSQGASDWERASSQDSSQGDNDDDSSLSDEDNKYRARVGISTMGKHRNDREEPESPRKSRHKSQQSDGDDADEGDDEEGTKPAGKAEQADNTSSSTSALSGLDLSEISKLSVFPGSAGETLVQGYVMRVKTLLGGSQYQYFIQDRLVLLALKQLKNRTSNYHMFDMTRAVAGSSKLTKKSGNYVGKLRANFSRRKYVLLSNLRRRTELGAFEFEPTASAVEPRRLTAVLPPLSPSKQEVEGLTVGDSSDSFSVLLELLESEGACEAARHSPIPPSELRVLESRLPVFENGYYRLNFHGRVSVPSVKNFQLVERARGAPPHLGDAGDARVLLQFGKVDAHKFHLDFRAPVTPLQAFALALAQFNF